LSISATFLTQMDLLTFLCHDEATGSLIQPVQSAIA